MCSDLF
jgi:serine/threonine protein kinase